MYASGPVGRMAVKEVLNAVRSLERRRLDKRRRRRPEEGNPFRADHPVTCVRLGAY